MVVVVDVIYVDTVLPRLRRARDQEVTSCLLGNLVAGNGSTGLTIEDLMSLGVPDVWEAVESERLEGFLCCPLRA